MYQNFFIVWSSYWQKKITISQSGLKVNIGAFVQLCFDIKFKLLLLLDVGRIYIHNSNKLASILPKYYGHSKYSSFLRQLGNYEFYRPPCRKRGIYVNNKTTEDVHSILKLKVCFVAINLSSSNFISIFNYLQSKIIPKSKKKALKFSGGSDRSKVDVPRSLEKSHEPSKSALTSDKSNSLLTTSIQHSNLSMSQDKSLDTVHDSSIRHSFSLKQIVDIENRVICVDRKLRVAGSKHQPEDLNSYYLISLHN